jgi:RNA polymerase-interacting CarD/CdnL/TRCF family regulator
MVKFKSLYTLGDMIVHRSYGVGKIDSIESKPMNGIEVECFKVITQNGDYWFPTEGKENPRIHPVASQKLIQRAITILRSAPIDLETDHLHWKERIDSVL